MSENATALSSDAFSMPVSNEDSSIKELHVNDVLLGRGPALSKFEGNLRFRTLVDRRKDEYVATHKRKEKKRIAKEIVDVVHSRGGRFLKQDDAIDGTSNGVWYEVDEESAMEKTKQSLREIRVSYVKGSDEGGSTFADMESLLGGQQLASLETPASAATGATLPLHEQVHERQGSEPAQVLSSSDSDMSIVSPELVPTAPAESATIAAPPPLVDPRLLLFRQAPVQQQQQPVEHQCLLLRQILRSQIESTLRTNSDAAAMQLQYLLTASTIATTASHHQRNFMNYTVASSRQDDNTNLTSGTSGMASVETTEECILQDTRMLVEDSGNASEGQVGRDEGNARTSTYGVPKQSSTPSTDDELAAFLLSSLSVSGRRIITNEEEELERQTMSNKERAAALSDLFGRLCERDIPQQKRAKCDLDRFSIAFLVRHMRHELDNIPSNEKRAMLEAQVKCRADEFSDARLEKFLRCEGMNSELAARRFVRYWESRRKVFGPEKYTMRMTISEALRDDLTAIKAGVYTLLPYPDVSGRQITYLETRRHNNDGYDSESMLRAFWYIVEVAAQNNTDVSGGIVQLVWFKDATVFDYDRKVYDQVAVLYTNAFPVKMLASHLCCPPIIITRVVQPIIHAIMDQGFRARTITHDVDESEIISVLESYGIQKDVIPTTMGGDVVLNPSEWLANRRALEMEEL